MKACFNHPDKKAFSICHSCGKNYCESCLDEGKEFYYCRNPECHILFKEEISQKYLAENVLCPDCKSELKLSEDEIITKKVHCLECEALIDFNFEPPKIIKKANYVEFLSSLNQGDISIIKSLLDNGGIDYYIFGENFLSVRPLLEPSKLFVSENQIDEAKELLKDFDLHILGLSNNQY
ncbi:MAG: putative signal transducing protein [Ignavibacteriaceae bacterium]